MHSIHSVTVPLCSYCLCCCICGCQYYAGQQYGYRRLRHNRWPTGTRFDVYCRTRCSSDAVKRSLVAFIFAQTPGMYAVVIFITILKNWVSPVVDFIFFYFVFFFIFSPKCVLLCLLSCLSKVKCMYLCILSMLFDCASIWVATVVTTPSISWQLLCKPLVLMCMLHALSIPYCQSTWMSVWDYCM